MSKTLSFIVLYHITFLLFAAFLLNYSMINFFYALLCYIMLFLGYLFPRSLSINHNSVSVPSLERFSSIFESIFLRNSIIALFLLLIFSINLMIRIEDLSAYRMLVFGTEDSPSILYGNQLYALIFNNTVYVISYVNLAVGVRKAILSDRLIYFIKYSIPLILSGLIMFDRGWIYILVLAYLYILLNKKKRIRLLSFIHLLFGLIAAFALTVSLSILRGDRFDDVIAHIFIINLLGYNVIGYQLMQDNYAFLNLYHDTALGGFTFGGLENIFYLLFRLINGTFEVHGSKLVEFFQLSYSSWLNADFNAFFTIFTPVLLDFGYLGGLIFFLFLGATYKFVASRKSTPMQHLKFALFLMFISFNQKPLLSSMGFTFLILLFAAQELYLNIKYRG